MKIKNYVYAALLLLGVTACGGSDSNETTNGKPSTEQPDKPGETERNFAKGADISWYTQYEKEGQKFYNAAGQERDCTTLMKELGLDAIRLRVWVNPSDGWCNKEDVVKKAKKAAELDMDVMIDFHYSDIWADPSKQFKPAAWKNLGLTELKQAIANHTKDVLNALKSAGVTPKWVQVGKEIRPGMLWDADANLSGASWDVLEKETEMEGADKNSTKVVGAKNWANLGAFISTGYDAVKSVFPQAIVIVHLDNGYDNGMFTWFFDELKKNNGKWDMIGMSIYPYWTMLYHGDSYKSEDKVIDDCISNINMLANRYNCDVMIVETGMECGDGKGGVASSAKLNQGKQLLSRLIKDSREKTNVRCKGVFYWEPECRPNKNYVLGAFTNDGKPTVIMDAFKD